MEVLRHIACAGNAVALLWLVVVLANAPALFFPAEAPPAPVQTQASPASENQRATRALFVIIDALRLDIATNVKLMPNLHRLASSGAQGVARVETLVPSTVAGVRALAEGVVLPPAAFVHDFRAQPAETGGLLQAIAQSGARTFVAGPELWTDLYRPWITEAATSGTIAHDDERLLEAALAACRDPHWQLVVVHLGKPDTAAHLHGAASEAYRAAAAWCDAALGQLLEAMGGGSAAVLVTSDHGVILSGGHAGPEAAVLKIPIVCRGAGMPPTLPGSLRQTDIPHLVATALGSALPAASRGAAGQSVLWTVAAWCLLAGAAVAFVRIAGAVGAEAEPRRAAFGLNATLWLTFGIALIGWWKLALLGAVAALIVTATRRMSVPLLPCLCASGAGLMLAGLRLADGWATSQPGGESLPATSAWNLAAIYSFAAVSGFAFGSVLRRRGHRHAYLGGIAAVVVPVALSRLVGETVSLSTLDVRLSFRLAGSPVGLPAAVVAAMLQPLFPILLFVATLCVATAGQPRVDRKSPWFASVAGGASAALGAQSLVGGVMFGWASAVHDQTVAALAVSLLARQIGEVCAVFGTLAAASFVLPRRPGSAGSHE